MVTWGKTTTFGTAPAPAPGTPGAGGGFTFGATPGTPTTPSTPTTPTPGPSLFGSTAGSTPAATGTGGGFFGTPTPATPTGSTAATPGSTGSSLFGTPSSTGKGLFGTPAPAPSTGLFGTPAPAPSTGLFGAPAPAPSTGLFGAPAPAPSTSLFGAPTPAPTSLYPNTTQPSAPQQAALLAQYHAQQRQDFARIESSLLVLRAAYDQHNPHLLQSQPSSSSLCRFQYLFYDPINHQNQMQMSRPPHVDPQKWAEAVARNPDPDHLVPISIVGAEALSNRIASQQTKATQMKGYMSQLRDALSNLQKTAISSSNEMESLEQEHRKLSKRMLQIMRKVEILRCMNLPLQAGELKVAETLENMMKQLEQVRVVFEDVEEMARGHCRKVREKGREEGIVLTEGDRESLCGVLDEQTEGLASLTRIVKRDVRDVEILKKEVGKIGRTLGVPPGM